MKIPPPSVVERAVRAGVGLSEVQCAHCGRRGGYTLRHFLGVCCGGGPPQAVVNAHLPLRAAPKKRQP